MSGSHLAISLAVIHRLFAGHYRLQVGFLVRVLVVVGAEPSVMRATSMSGLAARVYLVGGGPSYSLVASSRVVIVGIIGKANAGLGTVFVEGQVDLFILD